MLSSKLVVSGPLHQKGQSVTRYHVDSDAVLAATAQAKTTISRVQSDLQSLTHSLHSLQASWGGHASTAFQSVFEQWRQTQVSVEGQLIALTEALGQAGRHYGELEAQNARLFSR